MKLKVIKLNQVKSTNDKAIELIRKNNFQPRIIVSKKQTKGKGTMGKKWISKEGNLFLSIFFETNVKPEEISIINPYIVKKALNKYTNYEIKVKWPNDLLVKRKKFSGILQESIKYKSRSFLIIGIGINTVYAPISKKFKSIALNNFCKKKVKNAEILKDIKNLYEKFISDINLNKVSFLKRKYIK